MLDTSFACHARDYAAFQLQAAEPPLLGNVSPIGVYPFDIWTCRDGKRFALNAVSDDQFRTFCEELGCPELSQDERFQGSRLRFTNRALLFEAIAAHTMRWNRDDLLDKLYQIKGSRSFPVGPVNGFAELHADPHLKHRGMLLPC